MVCKHTLHLSLLLWFLVPHLSSAFSPPCSCLVRSPVLCASQGRGRGRLSLGLRCIGDVSREAGDAGLEDLTRAQLQTLAKKHGLKANGKSADLIVGIKLALDASLGEAKDAIRGKVREAVSEKKDVGRKGEGGRGRRAGRESAGGTDGGEVRVGDWGSGGGVREEEEGDQIVNQEVEPRRTRERRRRRKNDSEDSDDDEGVNEMPATQEDMAAEIQRALAREKLYQEREAKKKERRKEKARERESPKNEEQEVGKDTARGRLAPPDLQETRSLRTEVGDSGGESRERYVTWDSAEKRDEEAARQYTRERDVMAEREMKDRSGYERERDSGDDREMMTKRKEGGLGGRERSRGDGFVKLEASSGTNYGWDNEDSEEEDARGGSRWKGEVDVPWEMKAERGDGMMGERRRGMRVQDRQMERGRSSSMWRQEFEDASRRGQEGRRVRGPRGIVNGSRDRWWQGGRGRDRSALEGVKLETMVEELSMSLGWQEMYERTRIRCFSTETGRRPNVSSALKLLRNSDNQWQRRKVEDLYLQWVNGW